MEQAYTQVFEWSSKFDTHNPSVKGQVRYLAVLVEYLDEQSPQKVGRLIPLKYF